MLGLFSTFAEVDGTQLGTTVEQLLQKQWGDAQLLRSTIIKSSSAASLSWVPMLRDWGQHWLPR
jgi:hypothetical protein